MLLVVAVDYVTVEDVVDIVAVAIAVNLILFACYCCKCCYCFCPHFAVAFFYSVFASILYRRKYQFYNNSNTIFLLL